MLYYYYALNKLLGLVKMSGHVTSFQSCSMLLFLLCSSDWTSGVLSIFLNSTLSSILLRISSHSWLAQWPQSQATSLPCTVLTHTFFQATMGFDRLWNWPRLKSVVTPPLICCPTFMFPLHHAAHLQLHKITKIQWTSATCAVFVLMECVFMHLQSIYFLGRNYERQIPLF